MINRYRLLHLFIHFVLSIFQPTLSLISDLRYFPGFANFPFFLSISNDFEEYDLHVATHQGLRRVSCKAAFEIKVSIYLIKKFIVLHFRMVFT